MPCSTRTLGAAALFFLVAASPAHAQLTRAQLERLERPRVLAAANRYLAEKPVTITAYPAARSAGGRHDYFSEGDYWWPDPKNPGGPYVQRDGQTNPDNFDLHRQALRRFSQIVPALVAAYELTEDRRYARAAVRHLDAWFADTATRMNPSLLYAQAIHGRATGRGIGIIDGLHLVEVAQATSELERLGVLSGADRAAMDGWFRAYLEWLTTSAFGAAERDNGNNHSTAWAVQVAEIARLLGDSARLAQMRRFYRETLLPQQMAPDGAFPRELARTKPYSYSLFNLDLFADLAQILSTPGDGVNDLWSFTLPDGRGLRRAIAWMAPFIVDKHGWPRPPDVQYFEQWPMRQVALLFGGVGYQDAAWIDLWKRLPADSQVDEVIRNFPVRQPLLWLH